MDAATAQFWEHARQALAAGRLVKLTLGKPAGKSAEWRNAYARLIDTREGSQLSFTLRYTRRDETKNFEPLLGLTQAAAWLGEHFFHADLFTLEAHYQLLLNKKREGRLQRLPATHTELPPAAHDQPKQRPLPVGKPGYLTALGIADAAGNILAAGQRKFRQINKYIEVVGHLLQEHPLPAGARIADMGSGKGYLTFALYDHLANHLGLPVNITGVELRPELVDRCNDIAHNHGFTGLQFQAGDINAFPAGQIDMLIALHACDTATDLALAKGIRSAADLIVVAPCCHKQIRRQLEASMPFRPLLKHGILLERQAELLTDGLRALLLEAHGYRTKVFEFVSVEHTPKNVMITATKAGINPEAAAQVDELKTTFGIVYHELERLLAE